MTTQRWSELMARFEATRGEILGAWHTYVCNDVSEPPDARAVVLALRHVGLACTADVLEIGGWS